MLSVVDEHESVLQRAKEEHLQQLEEVKRATESSGFVFFIFAFNLMVQCKLLLPCCTSVMSKTSCFINLMPFRATYSIRPLNKFLQLDLLIYKFNFLRQVA